MSERAWLSLGANEGDALTTLAAAVLALDDVAGLAVEDTSGVYLTAPWPPPEDPRAVPQPPFRNLVVRVTCSLTPRQLLAEALSIEAALGRDRTREVRWGPRPIDIDLLLFGDLVVDEPELVLPHPRLAERAFVLVPLLEVAPGGRLPDGRPLARLLSDLAPVEGVELELRLDELPSTRVLRPEGPAGPPAGFGRPGPDPDVARGEG